MNAAKNAPLSRPALIAALNLLVATVIGVVSILVLSPPEAVTPARNVPPGQGALYGWLYAASNVIRLYTVFALVAAPLAWFLIVADRGRRAVLLLIMLYGTAHLAAAVATLWVIWRSPEPTGLEFIALLSGIQAAAGLGVFLYVKSYYRRRELRKILSLDALDGAT